MKNNVDLKIDQDCTPDDDLAGARMLGEVFMLCILCGLCGLGLWILSW